MYKNQRVVRKEKENRDKNLDNHPIFMGPVLLYKEATYNVYKTFLEHVATEVDNDIDEIEVGISEQMEFGSDDEKSLTNLKSEMRSFKSNENIHKKEGGSYYVVSAN